MKKHLCLAVAACGLLSLASCSDDENVVINDQPEVLAGEQVITLNVQETDVLSTKSRPLYSTEAQGAERVTDVKLFVFGLQKGEAETSKPMKLSRIFHIQNWDGSSEDYRYGREYAFKIPTEQKLDPDSTYTIIAVGQDENVSIPKAFTFGNKTLAELNWSDFAEDKAEWAANTTPGSGFLVTDTVKYSLEGGAYSKNTTRVSEIFSGTSEPVQLTLDGGFQAKVLLKRQVAGVLGYFNRIPAYVITDTETNDHTSTAAIRLVASNRNNQLDMAIQLSKQQDDYQDNRDQIESIVNGFRSGDAQSYDAKFYGSEENDAYTIYQIDLTKWFAGGGNTVEGEEFWNGSNAFSEEESDNGYKLLNETNWVNALRGTNDTPIVADGAVLAGEFVIPFDRVTGISGNTFELQLLDSVGNVTKKWDVKLDEESLANASDESKDTEYVYSVYRNHLYQIGQRGSGDDPENPGEDPDKPQPLDKSQELTIRINDNWEAIHNMEIE